MSLDGVRNIVLVLSGKGGVGKSSITVQLALSLSLSGYSVGILDLDLTGPSIPRLLGVEGEKVTQVAGGWKPVRVCGDVGLKDGESGKDGDGDGDGEENGEEGWKAGRGRGRGRLTAMSLAFLLRDRGDAVVWRGPKKTAMVRQFLSDVLWTTPQEPALDYLLIDTPPGTSDEHISLIESLHSSPISQSCLRGAVVVTTPQAISTADVKKELNFCRKTGVPVIGVVENMAGYVCPCCGEVTNVFSKGGGRVMAEEFGVRYLGGVPIDSGWGSVSEVRKGEESGEKESEPRGKEGLVERYGKCHLAPVFEKITARVVDVCQGREPETVPEESE